MSAYELRLLTLDRIDAIIDDWQSRMDVDVFESEFSVVFDYARRAAGGEVEVGPGNSLEDSELVDRESGATVGLIDMVRTRMSRQLKVLHFHFGPSLWDYESGLGDHEKVADAYIAAVSNLLTHERARTTIQGVKIYGRSNELLEILTSIVRRWPTNHNNWQASMEGRFLLFRPIAT